MKNYILFDFDGVIADSFQPAFEIQKKICPHLTEDIYRKRFEGNINDWEDPVNVHTEDCRHDIDFFTEYIPRMKNEVEIVPDIEKTIMELEKKYTLVVISSTITSPIRDFLKSHDLSFHFDWVMGNDIHKSKVEKMKMVFSKYNTTDENCIFITDTLGDMREASELNIASIGVTWGFHKLETLTQGNPFCIIEKPKELTSAINDYFEKRE